LGLVIVSVVNADIELVSEFGTLVPLCGVLVEGPLTSLDTLYPVLERLLLHLSLLDLLDLDLLAVLLEISLSLCRFGLLDSLSALCQLDLDTV
jgi:hypothetical protein